MYNPAGGQTYNLGSSISSTATTILLSSFTEPVSGTPYTMGLLNTDIAYATIAPRTSSSEFISFTDITQNADGSATLTGVTRGLAKKYPFTEDTVFKLPHSGQSLFILSDVPQVWALEYFALENDNEISGDNEFTNHSPVIPTEASSEVTRAASIQYVNDIAISGAPDAALNVKGITELSVEPVSPTTPIAVGDNDPRVVKPVSNIITSRAMNAANGAVVYAHGLGRIPTFMEVIANQVGTVATTTIVPMGSYGTYNGVGMKCIYYSSDGTDALSIQDTVSIAQIASVDASGDFQTAVWTSWDDTNATLTWTKTGTPTGDVADIIMKFQ